MTEPVYTKRTNTVVEQDERGRTTAACTKCHAREPVELADEVIAFAQQHEECE